MPSINEFNQAPSASIGKSDDISTGAPTSRQTGAMSTGEKFKYAIGVAGNKLLGTAAGVAGWMPGGQVIASALGQGAQSFNGMTASASASMHGQNRGPTAMNMGDETTVAASTSVGGQTTVGANGVGGTSVAMGGAASSMTGKASFGEGALGLGMGGGMAGGMGLGSSSSAMTGAAPLPAATSSSMQMGGAQSATTGGDPMTSNQVATGSGSTDSLMQATQQMQETQMSFNLQYLQLQNSMQNENRQFTMVSNIMKTKHDTAKNTISNVH